MPGKPHSEQRQRQDIIALRVLPAERAALEAAAQDRAVSLSEFIRTSALAAAQPSGRFAIVYDEKGTAKIELGKEES